MIPVQQHDVMTPGPGPAAATQQVSAVTALTPQVEVQSSHSPVGPSLPVWLWPVFVSLALLAIATANPMLTTVGILVVPMLVSLLWRSGEPPILILCCMMQWLQVITPVLHADLLDKPLDSVSGLATHETATWLSLVGVVAMAVGMRLALKHRLGSLVMQIEREMEELNLPRVFFGYLGAFGLAAVCGDLAWKLGGLAQLVLAVSSLKWALLWLLLCTAFVQGRGYQFVIAALVLEVGIGFLGYFATFKDAFFVLGIALLSIRKRLPPSVRWGLGAAVVALLAMMILWQSIKKEYRMFLSNGAQDQSVRVSVEARIAKLGQLLENLDAEVIRGGIETLVERVGYTELFAATLEWVPESEPHSGGELFKAAILHPLMPRLLFPTKEVINDSERARRFTGRTLSGSEDGTSIGIGYMAECYADLGTTLMFLPILLLGYVIGRLYRALGFSGKSRMWGMALAIAALFVTLQAFATTGAKLFGAMLTTSLVLFAIDRVFGARILRWLHRASATTSVAVLRRSR